MPSEKPARRLRDILENADAIARYTEGMDLDAFTADAKTRDAVGPRSGFFTNDYIGLLNGAIGYL